ncbi:MAG: phage integrase SAM-like domain-containing protein [Phycisphaerales bacterium]
MMTTTPRTIATTVFMLSRVTDIGDTLHERLAKVGLVEHRDKAPVTMLGQFTTNYIESRRADAKPRTIINPNVSRRELVRFFSKDRPMQDITSGHAIEFRSAMLGRGLADNTVRRHLGRARQFFAVAIDKGLIQKNPFFHKQIKVAVRGNPDRRQFIPRSRTNPTHAPENADFGNSAHRIRHT